MFILFCFVCVLTASQNVSFTSVKNIDSITNQDSPVIIFPPESGSGIVQMRLPSEKTYTLIEGIPIDINPSVVGIAAGKTANQGLILESLAQVATNKIRILFSLKDADVSAYRYLFDLHVSDSNSLLQDSCNLNMRSVGSCNHSLAGYSIASSCSSGGSNLTCNPGRPVRIAFISDWGYLGDGGLAATSHSVTKRGFDRYVFGGDNVYESGITSPRDTLMDELYVKNFRKVPVPQYVVEGNHDAFGSYLAQLLYSQYQPNWRAEYYYLNHTIASRDVSVCLVLIDTERFKMSGQNAFLHSVLGSYDCQLSDYIVLAGHHPVFSSGGHGDSASLQKNLLPFLIEYKADLYICGHDHTMSVHEDSGVTFVVAGASGKRTTDSLFLSNSKAERTLFFTFNTYGFADLQFGSSSLGLRLVDSTIDKDLYAHNWPSRRPERLEANIFSEARPVSVGGTTPFYSGSTFVLMAFIVLVWFGGVLSIQLHRVISGAKKIWQIILT